LVERLNIVVASELGAGTLVGEYRVTHKLGEGGMGVVYAGIHPEIGKRVAIKILGPQAGAYPDLIRRFKEEARAVNKIRHPNIIDVFAFNQLPDGRHYFVMEYLDGESLTDRLARGPMDFTEMRRLLGQICSALHAAHEAGVVHRDLKPDNIWVATQTMSESRIKLLDFGIAKLSDVTSASATRSGVPMGTPLYMPPEQGLGRVVDRRADVYALGVLLYQVFAGTLPFYGASGYEIVLKHVTEPPVPPSRHRPVWPKEMEAIILDCLEKDPSKRPASAKLLADRLEAAFVAHAKVPVSAGVASTVPRLTTPPLPPALGEPVSMPSQLPSWVRNLPAASPESGMGGTGAAGGRRRVLVAALAALVVGGSAAALFLSRPASVARNVSAPVPAPIPPLTAPHLQKTRAVDSAALANVRIRIDSDPPGARVIGKADGRLLGDTPLSLERPRSASPLEVRLELREFKTRDVTIPLTSDFASSFQLTKPPARTRPSPSRSPDGPSVVATAPSPPSVEAAPPAPPAPRPVDVPTAPKKDSSSEIIKWRVH
jgi:serine/threonine-protein kinase